MFSNVFQKLRVWLLLERIEVNRLVVALAVPEPVEQTVGGIRYYLLAAGANRRAVGVVKVVPLVGLVVLAKRCVMAEAHGAKMVRNAIAVVHKFS